MTTIEAHLSLDDNFRSKTPNFFNTQNVHSRVVCYKSARNGWFLMLLKIFQILNVFGVHHAKYIPCSQPAWLRTRYLIISQQPNFSIRTHVPVHEEITFRSVANEILFEIPLARLVEKSESGIRDMQLDLALISISASHPIRRRFLAIGDLAERVL